MACRAETPARRRRGEREGFGARPREDGRPRAAARRKTRGRSLPRSVPQAVLTSTAEPRQQRSVQTHRDSKRRQCPIEHVAVPFLAEQTALQDALRQFLDKQWHAVGAIDDLSDHLVWQWFAVGDLLD